MKKLEQIQINKLISNYGGVGSIVETNSNGSLLILPYENWRCFDPNRMNHNIEQIDDARLLHYVQNHGYQHVNRLVPIPNNDLSNKLYSASNGDIATTVTSKYFPEWFFCPRCRKLHKLSEWRDFWNENYPQDNRFDINPPACPYCSSLNGNGISRYPLQQIRFVMASLETGKIDDVAFDYLWNTKPADGVWLANGQRVRNLKYRSRIDGDGLNSIYIENTDTTERIYLSEIARNFIIKNGRAYKMVVRGSLSLYFPEIVRSLYIPLEQDNVFQADNVNELDIHEFRYLTNDDNYKNNMIVSQDLVVKRTSLHQYFVSRISAVERLKETSVLLSYTRMGKYGDEQQWYNVIENGITNMAAGVQYTIGPNTTFMPAVEAYGEGLFFEINYNGFDNIEDYGTFIHTFCHIVMKEMEFQCGYPLTSLKEKIYVDDNKDCKKGGFLIYTISGSEGSYGGLISLSKNSIIIDLIKRGAERARYCPNDPICENEREAHCFACLDLPETSCIKFNKDLNRNIFLKYWSKTSDSCELTDNLTNDNDDSTNHNSNERPSGLIL